MQSRNKPKLRKCKICQTMFEQRSMGHVVCSPACAVKWAAQKFERDMARQKKAERAQDRERREKLKSLRDWLRDAQAAVNAYVRERDRFLPCISCGRMHKGQWHAGHYLSRGARPELALNPLNIAKQCAPCNTYQSGNQAAFRIGLIERIGLEAVEWLEGPHEPKKYTVDEAKAIRDEYRAKLKALRAQNDLRGEL